ncbi:hypothetical protein AOL_s00169g221 [Orbilia oligospora ATCC 24927]|uniref:tyrosinase n=1 Tax=Arthrobotrys oligospora (strain ATCC 24927 / CBS 115.81 / DSM 1491) TaxID=756982 RepID=G1XN18_ARTOA|nr:hypothetical protein AOL_s00169g221 [Orbilia oligospora ATCC 24927]EGX45615.1 hypothetical protein AOL_s00169g221 [Orbilia oligospora ATCC 24927]
MAVWSSLKYAVVASCAIGLTQVEGLPTAAPSTGMTEWGIADRHSLFARQQNTVIVTGAQGTSPSARQVSVRKEIRQLINNRDQSEFHLFLLALRRMQNMRTDDPLSYYQIAGIHGRPYMPWAGVTAPRGTNTNTGYCTHADVLFLPWHRPYLSLFEQSLWSSAAAVVEEIRQSGNTQLHKKYNDVLPSIRLPYWDWAADASVPREVGEMPTIQVETQRGMQTIPNPLYTYRFQTNLAEFSAVQPFGSMRETYRWPSRVNTADGYMSQGAALNNAMRRLAGDLRNRAYRLLSYGDFNTVGTRVTPPGQPARDSLEGLHDTIHGTTGSGGHMSFVDNAAFDPIFWLHHANMDRLFAIWQAANPGRYTLSGSSAGTYAIPRGTQEHMNLQMPPFRSSENTFHTPAGVTRPESFGYSYVETLNQTPGNVIAAVNRLYSTGTPSGNLGTAVRAAKHKRSNMRRQDAKPADTLNTPPSADALTTVQDKVVENKKYQDWETEIKVNNAALKSSFNIHVFLGDVPSDSKTWATDKNLVGTHSIITTVDGGHMDSVVGGTVPLTSSLLNKVVAGEIKDLEKETVVPYLKKNLKVRISLPDGESSEIKSVDKLVVQIAVATVALPASKEELPSYGKYEVQFDAIDVPKGNFGA